MRDGRGHARDRAGRRRVRLRRRAARTSSVATTVVGDREESPRRVPRRRSATRDRDRSRPGQRTPLFTIADYGRYSWYVRLAELDGGHSWTGIVRCEAAAHLPIGRGRRDRRPHGRAPSPRRVASRTWTRARPRTSCRSAALERVLRHRMGDAGLVYGALRERGGGAGGVVTDRVGRPGPRVRAHDHGRVPRRARRRPVSSSSTTSSWSAPRCPRCGEVRTYGVVTEAEAVYEGAAYESDTHRIAELGIMPAARRCAPPRSPSRASTPRSGSRADPGETVERATRRRAREGPLRRRDGAAARRSGSAATGCRSTSTSTSSTGARAGTCPIAGISGRRHEDLVRLVLPARC